MNIAVRFLFSVLFFGLLASCSSSDDGKHCVVAGCSHQLCLEKGTNAASTCEASPRYDCYKAVGVCEQQGDGKCGWTPTDDLSKCLTKANARPPFLPPSFPQQ